MKKLNSLYKIVGTSFFIVVTITLIVQITYNYLSLKQQLISEIESNIKISTNQLKNNVIPYMESYEVIEYENLLKNELLHENLLAIIVEDYLTGEVIGEKRYLTGVIKVNNINIVRFTHNNKKHVELLSSTKYFNEIKLVNKNNKNIGKLVIYGTDYLLKKQLNELLIKNIIFSIIIYVVSFFILFSMVKLFLVMPINNIVNGLKLTNDLSIPNKIDEYSSKEFSFLSNSINNMIDQISKSQEKIKESNFRWQFAVEGNGDGLWDWNLKTNNVFFSKKWKEMLGFKDSEIKGSLDEWKERVHPNDLENVYRDVNNHFEGKTEVYKNEHRVKCKDGKYKWILDRGIIVERDNNGNALRMIGTHTDISERKIYEKDMKQALSVFENTHDGILITNAKNEIINVNKAFTKTTGYKIDDIKYKNPSILSSSLHDKEFYIKMWKSIKEKGFWTGEITNKNKKGELYTEYLTINTIKNENNVDNYIGIFSDISILKQQEKMLLQQSRTAAVGEMIGNIAHQWRQPLSMISTISTGVKLQLEIGLDIPKDDLISTFEKINVHTQHLSNTIEDFRNFFRDDITNIDKFNLSETFKKIDSLTADSFNSFFVIKNIDIEEEVYITGNQNLLIQSLINIYNNSIDVLKEIDKKEKKLFFVSLEKIEDKVVIKIKDNGGGIEESYLEKIFEPYFTTKHKSVGTGLGLYMSHQIIFKQLKGTLEAFNCKYIYENKEYTGATFKITLPTSGNDLSNTLK